VIQTTLLQVWRVICLRWQAGLVDLLVHGISSLVAGASC